MKRWSMVAGLIFLGCASPSLGQSPLDGTWVADDAVGVESGEGFDIVLKGESFTCNSCTPAFTIPADGKFHPVKGYSDFDEVAVWEMNQNSVTITRRKNGAVVYREVDTIAEDGVGFSYAYMKIGEDGVVETGEGNRSPSGVRPAGAHLISGEWFSLWRNERRPQGLTVSFATDGDKVSFSDSMGASFSATFGGEQVPFNGSPDGLKIKIQRTTDKMWEGKLYRSDKAVGDVSFILRDDGTLAIISTQWQPRLRTRYHLTRK